MGQRTVFINATAKKIIFTIVTVICYLSSFRIAKAEYDCDATGSVGSREGCPPELSGLQETILRVVTIGISLLGLVVLFLLVKAGIQIMTAGDEQEKKAKGIKQLQMTILGLIGIFLSYGLIVVIAKWLGLVEGQLSFVKGSQLIFDFMLPAGSTTP